MQAVKNWCDGERVKKLGTLRQTKQGIILDVQSWQKIHGSAYSILFVFDKNCLNID
jgi:hypothetical protein